MVGSGVWVGELRGVGTGSHMGSRLTAARVTDAGGWCCIGHPHPSPLPSRDLCKTQMNSDNWLRLSICQVGFSCRFPPMGE